MLIRANTLAFGLIGKDGPHGIIKICFWNMNLVFGSEVALLGFWEYMFRILFRVYCTPCCWFSFNFKQLTNSTVQLILENNYFSSQITLFHMQTFLYNKLLCLDWDPSSYPLLKTMRTNIDMYSTLWHTALGNSETWKPGHSWGGVKLRCTTSEKLPEPVLKNVGEKSR